MSRSERASGASTPPLRPERDGASVASAGCACCGGVCRGARGELLIYSTRASDMCAGAVVLSGTVVESQTIYAGVPAKWVKNIAGKNREMMVRIAGNYQKYASWFQDELPKKA